MSMNCVRSPHPARRSGGGRSARSALQTRRLSSRRMISRRRQRRTHAHAAEVDRVSRLRSFVTGPRPRLAYAMLPLLGLTMLASSAVRRWQGGPEVAGGDAEAPALGGNWRRRTHKERWKEQQ